MFVRVKGTGKYHYLELAENHHEGQRTVQPVLFTLGRLDQLTADGSLDALLLSLSRFGQTVHLSEAGDLEKGPSQKLDLSYASLSISRGLACDGNGR